MRAHNIRLFLSTISMDFFSRVFQLGFQLCEFHCVLYIHCVSVISTLRTINAAALPAYRTFCPFDVKDTLYENRMNNECMSYLSFNGW